MDFEASLINGILQGGSMVAVFAIYLDRRLAGIEAAVKDLACAMRGDKK